MFRILSEKEQGGRGRGGEERGREEKEQEKQRKRRKEEINEATHFILQNPPWACSKPHEEREKWGNRAAEGRMLCGG